MKVLFLTNGPAPYRVDFFNEIGKLCDLTVIFERQEASNREWIFNINQVNKFKAVFLKGFKTSADTAFCISVKQYLKKNVYDAIIVGGYSTPTGLFAIKYLRYKKIPFILNADGGFIRNENKLKYLIKKHFIKRAKYYLSSGKITNQFFEYYGVSSHEIYEYPFSSLHESDILDKSLSYSEKTDLKKELNINEDKTILAVGQFIYRKGFDVLLEACNKLSKEYGIYIVGGEPNQEHILLKEKYKLDNVHFIGFKNKDELRMYYMASDLFVLPTREDVWGLVINEAMACGLPIITTDKCIAGLELIKDFENGFIVPVERADILAERIEVVLSDKRMATMMAAASLEKIRPYTIENMASQHFNIFRNIMNI